MAQNRVSRAAPWITRRLRLGLLWLWENKHQPKGALIQQQGIHSGAGECDLGICPDGYKDKPVVVLEVSYQFKEHGRPEGYLTEEEAASFTRLLERAAWKTGNALILETWGAGSGIRAASASFQLSRRCGKGPAQLMETHKRGCPKPHRRLLCSWDGCTWFDDGYKKARLPQGWR